MTTSQQPIVSARNLTKDFTLGGSLFEKTTMRALNAVSFDLFPGEALAIVGESGSGKSTGARILSQVHDATSGEVTYRGKPLHDWIRQGGKRGFASQVQMIFQDPFGSLNPVHRIFYQIARPLQIHGKLKDRQALTQRVHELLETVGLSPAAETAQKFPYELSGGQRQRVAIARALAVEPDVILADEPISMLDVSIRLGILNLMMDLKDQHGIAFMYITHDIATARYFAERTAVMYVGHMVEWGNSDAVTQTPQHPYTQLLLAAVPQPGAQKSRDMTQYQHKADIPMWQPDSKGCPFAERCPHAREICKEQLPGVTQIAEDHFVRCYLYEPDGTT
ncbi:ABC transporter ATP-binding protein [Halomonas sp. 18H]|uniref:ABC transporter ATP-binding protein n=1 Tax=Halomonas almeriensis TaxID=308163 RepID=UPI002232A7B9|nr:MULTISPECIES: ABC transporter ATP-binding protein [Halomonas]MCW4149864.1 ABC transporter ATP-binding protein [Halomonas sp. 18H]MDN3553175.1 ABC transporter ATP-binding protein [Halomonas almeriensis]